MLFLFLFLFLGSDEIERMNEKVCKNGFVFLLSALICLFVVSVCCGNCLASLLDAITFDIRSR